MTEKSYIEYGQWLREQRARAGYTLAAVAEKIGVSKQSVSLYERGMSPPSRATQKKIEGIFGEGPKIINKAWRTDGLTEETFPERVRLARIRKRLRIADLADIAGVSVGTIHNWERGIIVEPRARHVMDVARALGVTSDWLIGGK